MCTFAHGLVMMFVLSQQNYQKGLTPRVGISPNFYSWKLAYTCIRAYPSFEGLADNNIKVSSLRPDERDTGELEVFVNGLLKGYAPLYPLSIIIALSYQLDSTEVHLFRKYICRELQRPVPVREQIYLHCNGSIN